MAYLNFSKWVESFASAPVDRRGGSEALFISRAWQDSNQRGAREYLERRGAGRAENPGGGLESRATMARDGRRVLPLL